MPANTNQLANDDYAELEIAHNNENASLEKSEDLALNKNFNNIKIKTLLKNLISSKEKRPGIFSFQAAVELDLSRKYPIGIKELFIEWIEKGNKYWLNPMDKSNGLGALEEILFKYQGDARVLSPFILILIQLAKDKISPRSFIEYVMLPRMRNDFNWRKWQENHLNALKIIAELVTKAGNESPFNQEHIGTGKTRLARDIVLVRYIGRPLAQFTFKDLSGNTMLENYRKAWQKITLQNPLSLYFMRNNALHFIYSMSGKIDLIQLVAIIEQLPDIERAFTSAFPEGIVKLKKIQSINLYDYDIDWALHERKLRGFHSLDYAIELKSYFNIVKALLEKPTGVYLLAYYAGLLKSYKDSVIAQAMSQLVRTLDDRGGMHIYKWHTEKLLKKNRGKMQNYINFLETHRGCDPDYPRVYLLFRDEENAREMQEIINLADNFGLNNYFLSQEQKSFSYKDLLNAYKTEYPDTVQTISDFQNQLIEGKDRNWTKEYAKTLDSLNKGENSLYKPLLRSVIRGIGKQWSRGEKGESFSNLIIQYGEVNSLKEIKASTEFSMRIKPVPNTSTEKDSAARKQINLSLIERTWNSLHNTEQVNVNVNNTLTFINKWSMELNDPLEKAFEKKVFLEESLNGDIDEEEKTKTQKEITKQDKTIKNLQEKKDKYNIVLENFASLNNEQKFIVTLIIAGGADKEDEEYSSFAASLLLQRYRRMQSISSRLEFLADDVSVDVLTLQQFIYLLNLLETLFLVLREDEKLITLLKKDEETIEENEESVLQKILTPYIVTKKKIITMDALDAAAKKMTGFSGMQAERAKWLSIIEQSENDSNNSTQDKYIHKMKIYSSKTFIDSHYGDMGGICLSGIPEQILRPGFFVQRLADFTDNQIIGMSLLFLSTKGFSSPLVWANNYWHAFAFNPLYSLLSHLTTEQQLSLYLQFRLNIEKISWMSKMPVVLSGIETPWGLISNNASFGDLIRKYEMSKPTAKKVYNAKGLSVYYKESEFAKALVIIDPRGYENTDDPSKIPTFYASRILAEETNSP